MVVVRVGVGESSFYCRAGFRFFWIAGLGSRSKTGVESSFRILTEGSALSVRTQSAIMKLDEYLDFG